MFNLCLYFVPLHLSTYNKNDIITIIIYFRLPLVVFANIKFNINKIRWSYLKSDYFSILFIIFSHTLRINSQYSI